MHRFVPCCVALAVAACGGEAAPSENAPLASSSSGESGSAGSSSGAPTVDGGSSGGPVVPTECAPGTEVLAADLAGVSGLAADLSFVYWTNVESGTVAKVPRCGGTPVPLVTGVRGPTRLALDDTHVFWTNPEAGTVSSVPKAGGAGITLATGQGMATAIAVDATSVYWVRWVSRTLGVALLQVPKAGGAPQVLTQVTFVTPDWRDLVIDATNAYFADRGVPADRDEGGVNFIPLAGGTRGRLAARVGSATALALDGENLFVASQGGMAYRVSLLTNDAVPLATHIDTARAIAVDATHVYWTNEASGRSALYATPKDGTTVAEPERVVDVEGTIASVVTVGRSLYWTHDTKKPASVGATSAVMRRSL